MYMLYDSQMVVVQVIGLREFRSLGLAEWTVAKKNSFSTLGVRGTWPR